MKKGLAIIVASFAAACTEAPSAPASGEISPESNASYVRGGEAEIIPGQYIVVFKSDVADPAGKARGKALRHGAKLQQTFTKALHGFSAKLSPAAAAALRFDPDVDFIEPDRIIHASNIEVNATWGLDRIDQHSLPLSTTFTYTNMGAGVTAYIIDSGILTSHSEFGGRASSGFDAVTAGGSAADCNGHGTHVAGTVGGARYGVAKGVSLVAVRVLGCNGSGSISGVIAGIDWVTANHVSPAVANMSLGSGASTALDNAVANSIASGVTYAISAGNGNFMGVAQDACKSSPARVSSAITVSATNNSDTKASWANFGSCVDLFAPGVSITSSWYTSNTATNTISGTSMAAPHVTGVAALYLQEHPSATPQQVRDALVESGTVGVVKSAGRRSPNVLLFTSY
jgi:subtilisin family serine protease